MTDKKQPEALRLAELLTADEWPGHMTLVSYARECVAELRRLHAENESLRAERERNLHSIRVSNEIINKNLDENETLRTGYAAARLEIESLRARSVAPDTRPVVEMCAKALAEELAAWDIDPPLHHVKEAHDACESWLAAIDAARAMRAAQPAGAQQPGAGTWTPLPGTLPEPGKPVLLDIGKKYPIRAMWVQKFTLPVGMEDDSGFGEYDEATDSYYCPEGWYEWNEHEECHWRVDKTPVAWCELPPKEQK